MWVNNYIKRRILIFWCFVYTITYVLYTGDKSAPPARATTLGELETEVKNLHAEIENIRDASNKVFTLNDSLILRFITLTKIIINYSIL